MGLLDIFKRNKQKQLRNIIKAYYGGDYKYFVWNYANQIYNIPEVRIAIEKIADIFASMQIYHKRQDKNGYSVYIDDSTTRILNYKPSPLQNGTQFIKNVVTQLLVEGNVFIEPIFNKQDGRLEQLYPLPFRTFEFTMDSTNKNAYVQFRDNREQQDKKYNLNDIIYLSRFCTLSGGKKSELGLYEEVIKSLGEQIVNVAKPNKPRAILQSKLNGSGKLKEKDKTTATEEVKASFANNVQGLAYMDSMWEITPINWNENDVNKDILQFVVNTVYNYFGINENIINNKASEIEMAMFINTTIKPLAQQFEKEFTNKLFTEREYYTGNRIEFDYQPLLITTMGAKTTLAQTGLRNGFFNIDEMRELFGYSPLDDGSGQVYRTSADLVNIKVVDEYQLGKVGQEVSTANAEDINKDKEVTDEKEE